MACVGRFNGTPSSDLPAQTESASPAQTGPVSLTQNADSPTSVSPVETSETAGDMSRWVGTYSFAESAPPDEMMDYKINIYAENDGYNADISIDGFQTMIRIRALVQGDSNQIKMLFEEYLPDNTIASYNPGDVLLSFTNQNGGIITTWGKIGPMLTVNQSPGNYFAKDTADSSQTAAVTPNTVSVSAPSPSSSVSFPADSSVDPAVYAAYYQKYNELVAEYGKAEIADNPSGSYLKGVCVAELMDFNGDGVQDLFVVFCNGQLLRKNASGFTIPQAGAYETEVWTYKNSSLTELLHLFDDPGVSYFYSSNNDSFDTDCCFVTVFENSDGLPVIQLYGETRVGFSVLNYHYSGGKLVQDGYIYDGSDGGYTDISGNPISKDTWIQNVDSYGKILLCAYLSSDSYSSSDLMSAFGLDYSATIKCTNETVDAISGSPSKNSQPAGLQSGGSQTDSSQPSGYPMAQADYIPPYLQKINSDNRGRFVTEGGYGTLYSYGLYDMDGDGVPELITFTGDCEANYVYTVYKDVNGQLVNCGTINGGHCTLNISAGGAGGFVSDWGSMGDWNIQKITWQNGKFVTEDVASGTVKGDGDYPTPVDYGLGDYSQAIKLCYDPVPYLLYQSGSFKP